MPSKEWREKHKRKCLDCEKLVSYCALRCRKCASLKRKENPEYIQKQSIAHKGKIPWNKGKKRPEHSKFLKEWWAEHPEEREKARLRALKYKYDPEWIKKVSNFGEKNPMWKGGIAKSGYKGFHQTLKDEIRKRDNFICQLCGMSEEESIKLFGCRLGIHHIDYDKTNCREKNLITLCNRCNSKVNFDREKWKKFFQEKIVNIYGNK